MSAFWFGKKSFSEELVDNYGRNIDLNGIVTEEINNLLVSFRKACSEFQKVSFSRQTNEMSPETLPEVQPFHSVGKYYAVLFFDGDSLSKWLSADSSVALSMLETIHPDIKNAYTEEIKKWSKENKQKFELMSKFCAVTPGYHKSISEALANFSLGLVKKIVEKRFLGRLIYSGGDDVLAILPPEMAFHCAKELRRVFSLDFVETKDIDNVPTSLLMGNKASASAGIVICPLKYPFGYALEKARQAEQKAKQNGRDSFYLELCNTSGDGLGFVDKWGEINAGKNSSFENLLRFFLAQLGYGSESDKLAQQGLSIKFPYELRKSLSDLCSAENPHFGELMKMEVERILKQQRYGFPKKESFDKEEREEQKKQAQKMTDQFVEKFKELWNSPFIKNAESKDESKGKLENKFLKLMDFFNFVLRLYRMSGEETQ
jgi:CRISPR-associated protein Cmr2